jgi:hypothetical protein
MKRFFAPVGGSSDPSKRARGDGGPEGDAGAGACAPDAPTRQPKSFMTWNCNSFLGRMRKELDKKSFLRYVEDHDPDIIALQETWLPAAAPDRYDTSHRAERVQTIPEALPPSPACRRPRRKSREISICGHPITFHGALVARIVSHEQTNEASYITTFATRAHNVRPEN